MNPAFRIISIHQKPALMAGPLRRLSLLAAGTLLHAANSGGAAAPVVSSEQKSESTPIMAVVPELNQMQKWNDMHGDTADPFWADDDNLYFFSCDGRGFGRQQRNFCFNKLTGPDLLHLKGELVNSMDEYGRNSKTEADRANWKVTGQECIDGVFYAFAVRNIYGDKSGDKLMRQTSFNASLIKSDDRGLKWTRSAKENYDKPMWPGTRFGAPGFIHYGRNGGDVKRDGADKFVYAISSNGFWNGGDDYILGRVRRADLPKLNAADWTYFNGGDGLENGSWTPDLASAKPILSQSPKCGWTAPVFIPALNRYLLTTWFITPTLKKWFEPQRVTYEFYESPHPWGPWTSVSSFDDSFLPQGQHMYGPNLCAKYQERNGEDVKVDLYTSGCPFQDVKNSLYKNWRIPLKIRTSPLPGADVFNDDDPAIHYTGQWQAGVKRGYHDHNDDVHYTNTPGDAAEFTFTGTGIEVWCEKFIDQGAMDVFVDGKPHGKVNLKQDDFPRLARIPVFKMQGLADGRHTIRIVNTGTGYIGLDAFAVTGTHSPKGNH